MAEDIVSPRHMVEEAQRILRAHRALQEVKHLLGRHPTDLEQALAAIEDIETLDVAHDADSNFNANVIALRESINALILVTGETIKLAGTADPEVPTTS